MRWRLLLVMAVAGMAAALPACKFDDSWETYCGFPGRCAAMDGGRTVTQFAQGSTGQSVTLRGSFLGDVSGVTADPSGLATVTSFTSQDTQISVQLDVPHGVDADSQFTLRVAWERSQETQRSEPFLITPIVVADGGIDDGGFGTYESPYATLAFASQKSGPGDIIELGPGQFASIFPAAALCDNASAGLGSGVTVKGTSSNATSIVGTGAEGTCAFNLYSSGQVVQDLTISGFAEGIRASQTGGRVSGVTITDCDAGVTVDPSVALQLQQVSLNANGSGLVVNGGNVTFEGGLVVGSARTGVWQTGTGGNMVLAGVVVQNNGGNFRTSPTNGAGVLLAGIGVEAYIDGGTFESNGYSGITVAGSGTHVLLDGPGLSGNQPYNLAVTGGSNAMVTMTNATIGNATDTGIYVEQFADFNGGTPDGGGGNVFTDSTFFLIQDARSSVGPPMTFARSTFRGTTPPAGVVDGGSSGALNILIIHQGNAVVFY